MGVIGDLEFSRVQNLPTWVFFAIPIAFLILRTLLTGIYNLYFHPLSHIPGPKRALFIPGYYTILLLSGRVHITVARLHNLYGPHLRLGPSTISFSSPTSWKHIYGHIGGRKTFLKSPMYDQGGDPHVRDIVSERDPAKHGPLRRLTSHAFSAKALTEQEDVVQAYVDKLVCQINVHATKQPEEMVKWYNFATFDVIGDLAFGQPFGSLDNGEPHFWVSMILDSVTAAAWKMVAVKIAGTGRLSKYLMPRGLREKRERHYEYSRKTVERRINSPTTRKDFMSKILSEKDAKGYDLTFLTHHSSVLIVAGSETTATFLSGVTYYLCRTPHAYAKLTQELRSAFSSYEHITGMETERCSYLKAVIDEGLRIYPPVSFGLPRTSPGEIVDGVFLPEGTECFTSSWAATHSELNFHRPYDFLPERWLDPDCTDQKEASQPFSLGSRVCLGRNLALMEMRLILAKMLWVYDMELVDDVDKLDWVRDGTANPLWRKPPLMVRFTRREGVRVGVLDDEA
ncbi:cytochrome P450 [Ascodesmis nigricans]|uniref:Cytochrome P450 n=1 Tax=Ascodesmis nigricans TaxID=341454 RepID=A0A4V3SHI1_9PEZI|nr:cytochrome P450 [Ascodesmis nigricans]